MRAVFHHQHRIAILAGHSLDLSETGSAIGCNGAFVARSRVNKDTASPTGDQFAGALAQVGLCVPLAEIGRIAEKRVQRPRCVGAHRRIGGAP